MKTWWKSLPIEWQYLIASVNGRSMMGQPGVRDPEYPCDEFVPGLPGNGHCDTDGHYMCAECSVMSRQAVEYRRI